MFVRFMSPDRQALGQPVRVLQVLLLCLVTARHRTRTGTGTGIGTVQRSASPKFNLGLEQPKARSSWWTGFKTVPAPLIGSAIRRPAPGGPSGNRRGFVR